MAMQGYRLLESESGHYLTEDWISNVCLMYAYDFQQDQYLWTARAYPVFRKDLNNTFEGSALMHAEVYGNDLPEVQGTGQIRQPDGSAGKKEKCPRPLTYPEPKVEPKDVMAAMTWKGSPSTPSPTKSMTGGARSSCRTARSSWRARAGRSRGSRMRTPIGTSGWTWTTSPS